MTTQTNIRTRPDGSIDTAFYLARGRTMRSEQAHRITRTGAAGAARAALTTAAALAILAVLPVVF